MNTSEYVLTNKDKYLNILKRVHREGLSDLIDYLENRSDFFTAPASTKYHGNFEGGLCAHSICVYESLVKIASSFDQNWVEDFEESIIIASLLHDISKANYYEKTFSNKKVYKPDGSKYDAGGKFDWETVETYKVRDDKFVYSNHEATSEFIARQFINLTIAESAAIMSHHGGLGFDSYPADVVSPVYKEYPLAMYLHMADLIGAYRFV